MESKNTTSILTKITPSEYIAVVNGCMNEYYSDPMSSFGSAYNSAIYSAKAKVQKDIEEYTRSRSFACIFDDLANANHWHQAIHFLLNCVDIYIPHVCVIQKILDAMLVIDAKSYVAEAQLYLLQLITFYSPNDSDKARYYWEILKEEEMEQKRVSSPRDPCGSFVNVLHQFDAELCNLDQKNRDSRCIAVDVSGINSKHDTKISSQDEEEDDTNTPTPSEELFELCDTSMLTGEKMKCWWTNASSEERIHRLLSVFCVMFEIFEVDLMYYMQRSNEAKKHPLARPIFSRLIWPYKDYGNPSIMLIKMIVNMYIIAHRNDLFDCMRYLEKLITFIAAVLPSSPLDQGDGYPPDSHQRRVFAQYIADALLDSGLNDARLETALARLNPTWLRLLIGSKIHSQRSSKSCGDLPLNVAQLAQMIVEGLAWGENMESSFDYDSDSDEEMSSSRTSTKGRKRKAVKRNAKGETQMHVLARNGKSDKLAELLAKEGGNLNIADYAGWTPVHEAVTHGNLECVRVLCEYRRPTGGHKMTLRRTPGMMEEEESAQKPRPSTTLNLHAKGGDMGLTPLHEAVFQNRVHIADLLLEFGGSSLLNDTTNAGLTPLDLASGEAMIEVLESRKEASRLVEKKWICDMKSNMINISFAPGYHGCIILRCMLLNCYLESKCLWQIIQQLRECNKTSKRNEAVAVKNIDYLEYTHDIKALKSFVKCVKSRLCGKITLPEACLLVFLC